MNPACLALPKKLVFWFQNHYLKTAETSFDSSLVKVGQIETAEQFWAFYQHMRRPSELQEGCYFYLFRQKVIPVWEDSNNDGAFVLKFLRLKIDRLWEDILLAFITDPSFINGVRLKVKRDFVEIDFWMEDMDNPKRQEERRKWVLKAAGLSLNTVVEVTHFPSE